MANQSDNQQYSPIENEETLEFQKEWLSGIQWHVAYVGEGQGQMAVAGYVQANDSDARLATIEKVPGEDDVFRLKMERGDPHLYEGFGEALDAATEGFSWMSEHDRERVPTHELTGHEGLYSLGRDADKEYVVDAFWSDQEPGYVNYNVFSVSDKSEFDILDSGFNNGFLSIEECVEFLADAHYPGEAPDIRFVADCTWEISTREELMEALEDGMLEEGSIPLAELQKENTVPAQVEPAGPVNEAGTPGEFPTLYALTETMEDENAIREFDIIALSESIEPLQHLMNERIEQDEYGLFAGNGTAERNESFAESNFRDGVGFVSYDISSIRLVNEQDLAHWMEQQKPIVPIAPVEQRHENHMDVKTMDGWGKFAEKTQEHHLNAYIHKGDAVGEDMVHYFVDMMSPTTNWTDLVQIGSPYDDQLGEDGKPHPTYGTFVKQDGQWYFAGNCFRGESQEPADAAKGRLTINRFDSAAEKPLDDLKQKAKDRATEKNAGRPHSAPKSHDQER